MSNPVTDQLTSWEDDAEGADTNQPTNATRMDDGQAGDLDGELRLLKSEIRKESLNKSWERWKGKLNLAAAADIAFTYVSATVFTVNDNLTSTSRLVAVVGRRVKATLTGSTLYGTITAAAWTTITTITVAWDTGSLDATLSEVQFGGELRSQPGKVFDGGSARDLPRIFERVTANATILNTLTETTIYSLSIPANTLGTNGMLRLTVVAKVTVSGSPGTTLTVRLKYGATTVATVPIAWTAGSTNASLKIEAQLFADGATNAQTGYLEACADPTAASGNDYRLVHADGVTEDSTGALTLALTGQWDTNDDSFTSLYAILEKL